MRMTKSNPQWICAACSLFSLACEHHRWTGERKQRQVRKEKNYVTFIGNRFAKITHRSQRWEMNTRFDAVLTITQSFHSYFRLFKFDRNEFWKYLLLIAQLQQSEEPLHTAIERLHCDPAFLIKNSQTIDLSNKQTRRFELKRFDKTKILVFVCVSIDWTQTEERAKQVLTTRRESLCSLFCWYECRDILLLDLVMSEAYTSYRIVYYVLELL